MHYLFKRKSNSSSIQFWRSPASRKIHERVKNWSDVNLKDTIYALSSGPGKCAISCIRISGPHSSKVVDLFLFIRQRLKHKIFSQLAHPPVVPKPRVATLKKLLYPSVNDSEREIIDEVIAIYFEAPHSFTGEDMVELFVHGIISILIGSLFSGKNIYH